MGDAAERGLECQKTMDGKASNGNGLEKEVPSCCLKALASAPELDAKCHSTVVSGWFSASQTCSGHYQLFNFVFLLIWYIPHSHSTHSNLLIHCVALHRPDCWTKISLLLIIFFHVIFLFAGKSGEVVYFNNPMWPGERYSYICSYLRIIYCFLVTSEWALFLIYDVWILKLQSLLLKDDPVLIFLMVFLFIIKFRQALVFHREGWMGR